MTASLSIDRHAGLQAEHFYRTQPDHERAIVKFASLQFFCLIYLQKFALFSPAFALSVPMLIMFASIGWQLVARHLTIVAERMAIFLIFCGFCLLSEAVNQGSATSVGQVIMLYVCMTACAKLSPETYRQILNRFIMFMILPSLIVFVQYFYQKATGLGDPLNLELYFPKSILMAGFYYNAHYPWNSTFSRPNGFFFLEPSFVSAFLASAAILEIAYFRRRWCAGLLLAATFFSMGATGISMLVIATPFLLLREKRQVIIVTIILIVVALLAAYMLDIPLPVVSRLNEFEDPKSSGSDRMTSSATEFLTWLADPASSWFGSGAGTSPAGQVWPLLKLLREYGPFAMFSFFALYFRGLVKHVNLAMKVALSLVYHCTGGYLLSPILVELVIMFCFLLSPTDEVGPAPPAIRKPSRRLQLIRNRPRLQSPHQVAKMPRFELDDASDDPADLAAEQRLFGSRPGQGDALNDTRIGFPARRDR